MYITNIRTIPQEETVEIRQIKGRLRQNGTDLVEPP